ncbi:hypothetical protein PSU4_30810 [Pseudonocardia sulfidoxydans NBRC 16205]|uniref:Uncharacterized protein n=1 Tax=Pseudonocardia sulfidoxydans NBRC 16205 TaxID=1223511 RepID=A0A511DI12_9PSEU|nr:hypothetical protein PSU4_30810 [Pseudonocardia sulfidoxydans NBRC 16205]
MTGTSASDATLRGRGMGGAGTGGSGGGSGTPRTNAAGTGSRNGGTDGPGGALTPGATAHAGATAVREVPFDDRPRPIMSARPSSHRVSPERRGDSTESL